MGEGYQAYLRSLEMNREIKARKYAEQQAMMAGIGNALAEAAVNFANQRAEKKKIGGMYQMKARDAGLYSEQPDYELPDVTALQERQKSIQSRRQAVEQEIAGLPPEGAFSTEGLGDAGGITKRRSRLESELQRNQMALDRVAGEIKRLKDSPNYADQVKAAQWENFLKKNPINSETYYRAMSYEPETQVREPSQRDQLAVQKQRQSEVASLAAKRQSYIRDFNRQLSGLESSFGKDKTAKIKIIQDAISRMNKAKTIQEIDLINSQAAEQLASGMLRATEAEDASRKETRAERNARQKRERDDRTKQKNANPVDKKQELIDRYGF